MKLTFLLTSLLLLAGCQSTPKPIRRPAVPNGDSPVVVADGSSLHVRNNGDYIRIHSASHASVDWGYVAVSFEVAGCATGSALPGCTSAPSPVSLKGSQWTLIVDDDAVGSTPGTTLTMDQTSTSAQPTRIDIQFPKSVTSKDEDPKSDGVGVFEDSVHLNSAKLSINGGAAVQYHCPDKPPLDPDGTHFCRMVIHYCEGACTH